MGCYAVQSGSSFVTCRTTDCFETSVHFNARVHCDTPEDTSILKIFFFNRHCNPCGLWPAQLSLSILSRKVFIECRCQRHVKPPTWRTSDFERSNSRHKVSPASETTKANPRSGRWNHGRKIAENFAESGDFHVT